MNPLISPASKIALVCLGGPENGPFSAMAARVLNEVFVENNLKISAIYTCSGSTPTALLGCTGDFVRLCSVWLDLTPRDIVGRVGKIRTGYRALTSESLLPSHTLGDLIKKQWDLEKIFSPSATVIKFQATDLFSREPATFSNRNPKHKKYFLEGVLGTMGLVPFLQPQIIHNPYGLGLIPDDKIQNNALLLVDGGYKDNMMLEEAMRDGYDVIFLLDIHGLKPTLNKFVLKDLHGKFPWAKLLRNCFHVLTNANSVKQFQLADRVNEEVRIKDKLVALAEQLPQEHASALESIIEQMNNGRLRLGDKNQAQIHMVANEEYSTLFNFANFKKDEPRELMTAGWIAAVEILESLGFDTSIVKPIPRLLQSV